MKKTILLPVAALLAVFLQPVRAADVDTIEEAFALDGGFRQMQSLYSLAGRSDASDLQHLLMQANELDDPIGRRSALQVLFTRLTELDPQSALALSRAGPFASDHRNYSEVWTNWGRFDMNAALEQAAELKSASDRNTVAQALYTANRDADPKIAEAIENQLGVRMNPTNLGMYVVQMSARSPDDAIAVINSLRSAQEQQAVITIFAGYLGRRDPRLAAELARKLKSDELRMLYASVAQQQSMTVNPRQAVERAMQLPPGNTRMTATAQAMYEYARVDPRGAAEYLDEIDSPMVKNSIAKMIASPLTQEDPDYAIDWARQTDPTGSLGLFPAVLTQYATEDPGAALAAANNIRNSATRKQAVSNVMSVATQVDPREAIVLLDQIADRDDASKAFSMVATTWLRSDPDEAVDWLISDPRTSQFELDTSACQIIASNNIDAAIRLLDTLKGRSARNMRSLIVQYMATQKSLPETMAFIRTLEGEEDYESLQQQAFLGAANHAPNKALDYAESLPRGQQRDNFLTAAITQLAPHEPEIAASRIDQIDDADMRKQAYLSIAMRIAQTDPEAAEEMLNKASLTEEERQQYEQYIRSINDNIVID